MQTIKIKYVIYLMLGMAPFGAIFIFCLFFKNVHINSKFARIYDVAYY